MRTFFYIPGVRMLTALLVIVLIFLGGVPAWAQDTAAPESPSLFEYAQSLYHEGDPFRAEGELKRFLYFHPQDARADEARELLNTIQATLESQKTDSPASGSAGSSAVGFYQSHLRTFRSPDSSCPSYPSCSEYAQKAMDKHGTVMGSFMFVDRFWREATTAGKPPYVYNNGRKLHYDPLEANDYWLNGQREGANE